MGLEGLESVQREEIKIAKGRLEIPLGFLTREHEKNIFAQMLGRLSCSCLGLSHNDT